MSNTEAGDQLQDVRILRMLGPGLIVAATGVGAGDIVSATVGGANHGLILLWCVAMGAFFKYVLNEGIARWQLATNLTLVEGWASHLPGGVQWCFGAYLLIWTVAVSAALISACGLGLQNLTGGVVPQSLGGVAHSLLGCAFVLVGGFAGFEKLMRFLLGLMVLGIVVCAALTFGNPAEALQGLFVPRIPSGGTVYVLSIIGGVGGSVTMLSYNYWLREKNLVGSGYVRFIRADLALAYVFTAILAFAIMSMAHQAFWVTGIQITDNEVVPRMAETLASVAGPTGFYIYSVGFWAAVFTSLLGVWQSLPYLFADVYGLLRNYPADVREQLVQMSSIPYRTALLFITLVPIPLVLLDRPLFLIVVFTVVSSLFIPFLAGTLLYLNNRIAWDSNVPHNSKFMNAMLLLILTLFLVVGLREIFQAF